MLDDYLKRKAAELGLGREDTLQRVQRWLEHEYPAKCRALSLNKGVLKIVTSESSIASDLRLRQTELLAVLGQSARIAIQIGPHGERGV